MKPPLGILNDGPLRTWDETFIQTCLILVCSILIAAIMWKPVPAIAYTYLVTFFFGLISFTALMLLRRTKPVHASAVIYFLNVVVCAIGISFNQEFWLTSLLPFQAFFGFKFIAFILALQAPTRRWMGWSSLIFLAIAPMVQYFRWNASERAMAGVQEPWITLIVVAIAGILYEQRLQLYEMLQRKARFETAAIEMRRYAHLLMGAQHLINTPLQTIEGTAELIRLRHPEAGFLVDRIDKAFEPIKEVNQLLSFGRRHVDWVGVQLPVTVADLEQEIALLVPETERAFLDLKKQTQHTPSQKLESVH